ncbi:MAG: Mur ligase [Arenimonas sp.]|nr:Mur ligase [Arenimonas sp.]
MRISDSRRLTGPNVYFTVCGAVLEVIDQSLLPSQIEAWRSNVFHAFGLLHWPAPEIYRKVHQKGATLGFTAPLDQLYLATEINEWAWLSACQSSDFFAPGFLDCHHFDNAFKTMQKMSTAEAEPALMAFIHAAEKTAWPVLLDEELLSIGVGAQTQSWPRQAVPSIEVLNGQVQPIPIAMVTGSNGKTTTVRLLSAILRASGLATGHSCTDGLFFNGELVEADDYSGPAGARATLRHPKVQAAVLETARGGLLRRGLACQSADVAMVTNISEDHFGEYGVFSLDDLAHVKLSIANGLRHGGTLVLNASDPLLVKNGSGKAQNMAWFAADWSNQTLQQALANNQTVCAVRNQRLCLYANDQLHDLGEVIQMPLSYQGLAHYNIENLAGAALAAFLLNVPVPIISQTLLSFGSDRHDNPGRLQSWQFADLNVLMDYAHNPEGLHGFLSIANAFKHSGRLGVLLGQAGNREDKDIQKLAETVASFNPDLVVLKDMVGYERGREPGEVPALLKKTLQNSKLLESQIEICLDEVLAVQKLLSWAKPGDVIALPVHGLNERHAVQSLLEAMQCSQWRAGQALPKPVTSNESAEITDVSE